MKLMSYYFLIKSRFLSYVTQLPESLKSEWDNFQIIHPTFNILHFLPSL